MRTSKIQNGRQGVPKWPTGSGKGSTPKLLGTPINFLYISFLIQALQALRAIRDIGPLCLCHESLSSSSLSVCQAFANISGLSLCGRSFIMPFCMCQISLYGSGPSVCAMHKEFCCKTLIIFCYIIE